MTIFLGRGLKLKFFNYLKKEQIKVVFWQIFIDNRAFLDVY